MVDKKLWQSATDEDWALATAREAIIRPLAEAEKLNQHLISDAIQKLGLTRAMVYRLIARFRQRPQASSLLTGKGGRKLRSYTLSVDVETVIQDAIQSFYLQRQKPRLTDLFKEIGHQCKGKGLKIPNVRTVKRRLDAIDLREQLKKRSGAKAARDQFGPPRILPVAPLRPLERVQIDHTPVDVIVVDERERLPIGRPWLTLAIDVASRVVLGFSVSLDPPSTVSVALTLTHAALRKDLWLADRELQAPWPMYGLPECLHLDNAREFHSKALARGGQEYGIKIDFRPPRTPHYGGHVERLIGTTMGAVHLLPGTTFSSVAEKGEYDSAKTSALTLLELERWLALQITGVYHNSIHSALLKPPLAAWNQGTSGIKVREPIDAKSFFIDFLPDERRLIRRDGIQLFKIFYWDNVLSPIAGRSSKPVIVKYDPRNLSRIYYQDGDGRYWTIPYRNLGAMPISLWEHREAMKRLQAEGRKLVDERLLFDTVVEQRQLIQSAQKSTRLRRKEERRHQMQKTATTTRTSDHQKEEPDYSDLLPYDVEEWS